MFFLAFGFKMRIATAKSGGVPIGMWFPLSEFSLPSQNSNEPRKPLWENAKIAFGSPDENVNLHFFESWKTKEIVLGISNYESRLPVTAFWWLFILSKLHILLLIWFFFLLQYNAVRTPLTPFSWVFSCSLLLLLWQEVSDLINFILLTELVHIKTLFPVRQEPRLSSSFTSNSL